MVQKVLAYITRGSGLDTEILTFTHRDYPHAGIQVPAGTVELGETLEEAVLRETEEESGLTGLTVIKECGIETYLHPIKNEEQERHFFHLLLTKECPDSWEYTVQSGSEDKGYVFIYTWQPLDTLPSLAGDQDRFISTINRHNFKV